MELGGTQYEKRPTDCIDVYRKVAQQYDAVFRKDKTHNLINRLRHNVIRTGLRRLSIAYSRISLAEVAKKLGEADFPLGFMRHDQE